VPQYLTAAATTQEKLDTGEPLDKRETIDNLLFLAGLDPNHLEKIKGSPALKNKYLTECSDRLTKALKPTWLSNPIDVELVYDTGDVLWVKVSDVHEDGTRSNRGLLSRRAVGFIWHFSFFVNFTAETRKADLRDAVILLDEPGLHLHPAQQAGTLRVLRQLAKTNQIIYTTHSPFMIYDYAVGRLLTVELDPETHLSTIRPTYWDSDAETLIPILHALEAPAAFGEAVGTMTKRPVAVVEGITDYQYLTTLLDLLSDQNPDAWKELNRVEFGQANGCSAIAPLALYHRKRGKNTVALYDHEPGAREQAERLKKFGFPDGKLVFCAVDNKAECDIEDLFSETDYLQAVNEVYAEILKDSRYTRICREDIEAKREAVPSLVRIVPTLESIWEDHKEQKWGTFDKRKVCQRICDKAYDDPKFITAKTQERFEVLFRLVHWAIGGGTHLDEAAEVGPAASAAGHE